MLPSPTEIAGFIELAETLNITKAAQRLGITQPTLSQALKKLETTVGAQLVIRSKNGVELTVAGKEFVKHAKRLMDEWHQIKSNTQRSTQEVRGSVRLGCHPAVGFYTLNHFLPELMREHSGIEVSLFHDLSRKVLDKIINYELDIGLVINPIAHPNLVMTRILVDEVKLWKAKDAVSDVLIIHPELLQTQDIMKKLKRQDADFKRVITSNSLEVITSMALKGTGYAIIPSRVVAAIDHDRELKAVSGTPIFKDDLYVVHHVDNRNVMTIKTIKERVIAAF